MQFKRQIAITLSIYYSICVIGLALSMHFCGGNLATISIGWESAACKMCASGKKVEKSDTCCKNTQVEVKVTDQHQLVDAYKLPKVFPVSISPDVFFTQTSLAAPIAEIISNRPHAPPTIGSQSVKIYIQNQVFRI